jgi:hypothetical protein
MMNWPVWNTSDRGKKWLQTVPAAMGPSCYIGKTQDFDLVAWPPPAGANYILGGGAGHLAATRSPSTYPLPSYVRRAAHHVT